MKTLSQQPRIRLTRGRAARAVCILIAIVLTAAACSSGVAVTSVDSTSAGSDAADTQAPPADDAATAASTSSTQPVAVDAAQTAIIPDAVCGNGELVEGVLDLNFMTSNELVGADVSWVSGSDFELEKWNKTKIQECGVSLITGEWLSIAVAHGGELGRAELESTQTVGGVDVNFLTAGAVITAQVIYDDAASDTGQTSLLFSLSNRSAGDDATAARAALATVVERVVPNVTFVSPAVVKPELDAYGQWKETMLVQWVAECEGGDLVSCDFLWYSSKRDSAEELAALTCGGTRDASANSRCTDQPETEGDHPLLDQYTSECRGGDELGCRKLNAIVSGASAYYDYANDCISELRDGSGPCSVEMFASGNDS